jgi:4'-phosphopantetheinyl transferase
VPFLFYMWEWGCCREVHVWYVCPDELNDHSHLDMYMELLSPSERKNALSMNGPRLQKDAMLSRALLRTTLSRCM